MTLIRTGARINTENTFERVRLLERGRYIESLRYLLMVRKADLYEVHCINSRLSRDILRWPWVALSSIISSRSIQKTIIMKQICRLPSRSSCRRHHWSPEYDSKTQLVLGFHLSTSTCTVFPDLRLESRFQRRRRLPSRGEGCSNKRD